MRTHIYCIHPNTYVTSVLPKLLETGFTEQASFLGGVESLNGGFGLARIIGLLVGGLITLARC